MRTRKNFERKGPMWMTREMRKLPLEKVNGRKQKQFLAELSYPLLLLPSSPSSSNCHVPSTSWRYFPNPPSFIYPCHHYPYLCLTISLLHCSPSNSSTTIVKVKKVQVAIPRCTSSRHQLGLRGQVCFKRMLSCH